MATTKPQGKGIVKTLGQKNTTGNFKKIEAVEGKGAAVGALQNKLAKRRGQPAPFSGSRIKKAISNISQKLSNRGKNKRQLGF